MYRKKILIILFVLIFNFCFITSVNAVVGVDGSIGRAAVDAAEKITEAEENNKANNVVASCTFSNLRSRSGRTFSIKFTYEYATDNFSYTVTADDGRTDNMEIHDNRFAAGGNWYNFYPYSENGLHQSDGYKSWAGHMKERLKKPGGTCENLFSFCHMGDEWYAETNRCDGSIYSTLDTQVVGSSSSNGVPAIDSSGSGGNIVVGDEPSHVKDILGPKTSEKIDCKELFQGPLLDTVRLVINTIKILVPLILLGLGSLDFAKAIFAQDEGAIKKSQGNFIKRVIIAIVIFLIPSLLGAILDIGNSIWPDYIDNSLCGIRENVSSASSTSGNESEVSSSTSNTANNSSNNKSSSSSSNSKKSSSNNNSSSNSTKKSSSGTTKKTTS